eukprot:Skav216754  [mRNA]  locus=scaffold2717:66200:69251:- [translate_table: standard]
MGPPWRRRWALVAVLLLGLHQRPFSVLEAKDGRKIAVVGANGCGKSTLLSYLSGREKPKEGRIRLQPDAHITMVEHLGAAAVFSCWEWRSRRSTEADRVLDTIYEKANTATARLAHDFRVAEALGGEALMKAMEKMEEMPEAWTWDEHVGNVAEERTEIKGGVTVTVKPKTSENPRQRLLQCKVTASKT